MRLRSMLTQARFVAQKLDPLPQSWAARIKERYLAIEARAGQERPANEFLWGVSDQLGEIRIPLAAGDAEIVAIANERARFMLDLAGRAPVKEVGAIRRYLEAVARPWGLRAFPCDMPAAGIVARLTDALWWRRQIRAIHARNIEAAAISLGYVHRRAEIYCSDVTLTRRTEQRRRNAAALENTIATNERGEEFTLADLAARSVANPRIRRGELMTRINGFEAVAQGVGHAADFVTLTCPSRMHARLSQSGGENTAYDGTTPRQAQRYLARVWARIRAAWARAGIAPYGFRIAEPHHDGTPHWHLLLFMPKDQLAMARRLFVRHALADSGDEPGARKNRIKFVSIDWARGTAAGYVAKYVAKNIDGYRVGADLFGNDAIEASARVEAWASTWGIRQFQQVGGPPVGVWRELRRIPETDSERVGRARAAADAGNWRAYVEAMGGTAKPVLRVEMVTQGNRWAAPSKHGVSRPLTSRVRFREIRCWPLAVATNPATVEDARTGEIRPLLNRYGEPATERPVGVLDRVSGAVVASMRHVWSICRKAFARVAAVVLPPWTCVNNCTGGEGAADVDIRGPGGGTGRRGRKTGGAGGGFDAAGAEKPAGGDSRAGEIESCDGAAPA